MALVRRDEVSFVFLFPLSFSPPFSFTSLCIASAIARPTEEKFND